MSGAVPIALRPFEAGDLEVLAPWLEAEGLGVPEATSHKVWGDRLRTDPGIVCRVATVGSDPVGFFRLDIGPDRAAEISVMVASSWRRRGVGRQLLALALAAARDRELARVVAAVRADNGAALAFFRGSGFGESDRRVPGFVHLHRTAGQVQPPSLESSP